jgi:hypothetical protein
MCEAKWCMAEYSEGLIALHLNRAAKHIRQIPIPKPEETKLFDDYK